MFHKSNPTPKEDLAGGAVELPRYLRGNNVKSILKNKERTCRTLTTKFDLNHFQVTNKFGEESEKGSQERTTCDAIISTICICSEMKRRCQSFDLVIPHLLYLNGGVLYKSMMSLQDCRRN